MSDATRDANMEGEAPVNPYTLLEAVNASSRTAQTAWLIFISLAGFLLLTVAGVTHKDLLLANAISLPILQVQLPLTRFFLIVPSVLLFAHIALLVQLVALARKSLELDTALRMVEATDIRSHPLRLELSSFFPVQAAAGPERSRAVGFLLHGLSWLTLAAGPVLGLLFIQATFLPYHHEGITWVHRALVLADVAVLAVTGVFLVRPEQTLRQALGGACRQNPVRSAIAVLGSGFAVALSLLVATIPGEPMETLAARLAGSTGNARPQTGASLFGGPAQPALYGLIERSLNVPDLDLMAGTDGDASRHNLTLRGRDLRHARLDHARLSGADLTGANLDGASLIGADLRGAAMGCVDGDLLKTPVDRNAAGCASARGANLSRVRLAGAELKGADLAGARLVGADLADATLTHADLSGANLAGAHLDKADLRHASLQSASLPMASLSGADFTDAALTGADLDRANLRAAVLNAAALEGVNLRNADLEAASLFQTRLFAADLTGARIRAASLREARVWLARIPDGAESALADLSGLSAAEPTRVERDALAHTLELAGGAHREDALGRLRTASEASGAAAGATWAALIRASEEATSRVTTVIGTLVPTGTRIAGAEPAPVAVQAGGLADQVRLSDRRTRLTRYLAELACQTRAADGAVATGIARRAQGLGFNGDPGVLLDSFRRPECAGGRAISPSVLERLANAVDLMSAR